MSGRRRVVTPDPRSTNERTLAAYEAAAERYVAAERYAAADSAAVAPPLAHFLAAFAEAVGPGGSVLEIGSATGRDAAFLEGHGLAVQRSDATEAFVARLRAAGADAWILNALREDLGGPWDAIYAGAVFLHFDPAELAQVLRRMAVAVAPGGLLAFTVKEGDGSAWTTEKLGEPRHFTYWREPALRAALDASPWRLDELTSVAGAQDDWLYCLCRREGCD